MSGYYKGVNDALFGAAMARASINLYRYFRQRHDANEVQRVFDELNDTCQEFKNKADIWRNRCEKAEGEVKDMRSQSAKIGNLVKVKIDLDQHKLDYKQQRIEALEGFLEKRKQRLYATQEENNELREKVRQQDDTNSQMQALLKETHTLSHDAIVDMTQKHEQLAQDLAFEESQSQKFMLQAVRYSGEAINMTWAYNKTHAMRVSLETNINSLFDQDKVDYPKDRFEHDVNLQYVAERLTLDQQHYQKLKNDEDHGLDEENWFPFDEYVADQQEKIRGR